MNKRLTTLLLLLAWPLLGRAQNVVTVTDADIGPGDQVTWTSDNVYVLDGFVFVEEGATLTIEPGTIVKGKPGTGENASALIIARGAKIYAEGTPDRPIIFTAEAIRSTAASTLHPRPVGRSDHPRARPHQPRQRRSQHRRHSLYRNARPLRLRPEQHHPHHRR
ncbi:hypothetical protein [Rhodothermus marinus]|uniref:hypothetical protein n=1 Tax=Rhodothermus marinus TaxID=29549 RepID=UPI000ADA780F|nr:hypothetical protein [Rhodothermus marinus]